MQIALSVRAETKPQVFPSVYYTPYLVQCRKAKCRERGRGRDGHQCTLCEVQLHMFASDG